MEKESWAAKVIERYIAENKEELLKQGINDIIYGHSECKFRYPTKIESEVLEETFLQSLKKEKTNGNKN